MDINFETQKSLVQFKQEGDFDEVLNDYFIASYSCVQFFDTIDFEIMPFEDSSYPLCYIYSSSVYTYHLLAKNDTVNEFADFSIFKDGHCIAHWRFDLELGVLNLNIENKILFFTHMQEFFHWRNYNIENFCY